MEQNAPAPDKGNETDGQADTSNQQPAEVQQPAAPEQAAPATVNLEGGAIPLESAEPAGEQPAADVDAAESAEPVAYELTLPDGFTADEASLEEFKTLAAELKLPAEGAQKAFDMFHAKLQKAQEASQAEWANRIQTVYAEQLEQCKADPEVGGAKYEQTREKVAAAIQRFAGERDDRGEFLFVRELKTCGMANNPQLFKFLARVGDYISEAGPVASDARGPAREKTPAEALFPNFNE